MLINYFSLGINKLGDVQPSNMTSTSIKCTYCAVTLISSQQKSVTNELYQFVIKEDNLQTRHKVSCWQLFISP